MNNLIECITEGKNLEGARQTFLGCTTDEKTEVLERLKAVKTESAAEFLGMVYGQEENKSIRKLIKKALFRLRTSGITVPDIDQDKEPVYRRVTETKHHRGFLSSYDPEGTRIIILGCELKRNAVAFFHAILHCTKGLLDLMTSPVAREGFDALVKDFQETAPGSMMCREISPAYAFYLLDEGSRISGLYRKEIKTILQFTSSMAGPVEKPEDILGLPVPGPIEAEETSVLLEKPIFTSFPLFWASMEQDRHDFESGTASTLLIPPYMVDEKKIRFIQGIVNQEVFREQIPQIRRVLEDYAYLAYLDGAYGTFKGLIETLANAERFQEILQFFVRQVFEREKKDEEQPPAPGLLINPYDQIRR